MLCSFSPSLFVGGDYDDSTLRCACGVGVVVGGVVVDDLSSTGIRASWNQGLCLSVTSTITPSPVRSPSEVQGSGFQRTFLGNTAPPITDGGGSK